MHRRALLSGVAAASAAALTGCSTGLFGDQYEDTREVEFDLPDEDASVSVQSENGDVDVSTHDGDRVSVTARLSGPSEDRVEGVEVAGSPGSGDLSIALEGSTRRVSADFDVQVPAGTPTGDLETSNGDVDVRDVAGVGSASSENGDVTVRSAGPVSAAETDNGEVAADVPAPLPGDVTVASSNGDVSVSLSPDADAEVVARTDNGNASIEGLDLSDEQRDGDEEEVRGVLGDGTHGVLVESDNGDAAVDAL
ncbi:DUF4097 family beta strand repeat-containing protein [Halobacterium rubrum]|uniref:DUF4097 family beta strand repeat-containing protein n=1 Tax=Halobacterium TaxID=2239 RepID=UPI001F297864|nr:MULTISPECIES: DUF4097 family beta strand repeat-containing protein [Halobacterium]MDH5019060.1 DUF4097 family beta strand repeat-containing protein [Halobacterium rubrum]